MTGARVAVRRGWAALAVTVAALCWPGPGPAGASAAAPPALLAFSADETAAIVALGPWPPPPAQDAGNALSGRPEAQVLGALLFFEPRLSPAGVACARCHEPARAFTDGRARSRGVAELDRNAPSLWNAVHERWLGWDGAADSLWSQALRPLLDPREMASGGAHVRRVVGADPVLAGRWREVFGAGVETLGDEQALVGAAKALGAHVATLVSPRSAFDEFRDALALGDREAAARYPLAAQRGLRLFVGRGNCHLCHGGPMLSHGEFASIGLGFFVRPGVVDPGRAGGIAALRASRYHLLSRWADGDVGEAATKTRHVEASHRNFGEFKVPSLRNVAQTAPYMHDGQLGDLTAVVRHYSTLDPARLHADGERLLAPLRLSPGEEADLLAFLRTL